MTKRDAQIVVSLTYDSRGVIYYRNIYIIQATEVSEKTSLVLDIQSFKVKSYYWRSC